ncbi:MAG TPA: hypothetical protein VD860_00785 [Azospirillum sp.]|nr:hypothetical protein [Azospirillum sp.]
MPGKPRKPSKPAKKRTLAPRKPRPDALVDPFSIDRDLSAYILRQNTVSRKLAIQDLLSAADMYRAEMDRTDGFHQARLNKREEGLILAAEHLLSTWRIFAKLTHRELEDWRQLMEMDAEREAAKPPPDPGVGGPQPIPFRRRPTEAD